MPTLTLPPSADSHSPAATEPLAGLRDIHLPGDISTLPVAPGWWLLAALLLGSAVIATLLYRRRQRRNQYRRDGAALLTQLMATDSANVSDAEQLQGINQLLKRVALVAYPNTSVASFYSRDWLRFLQQAAPGVPQPPELAEILTASLYSPRRQNGQVTIFHQYARRWIAHHVPERKLILSSEVSHAAL